MSFEQNPIKRDLITRKGALEALKKIREEHAEMDSDELDSLIEVLSNEEGLEKLDGKQRKRVEELYRLHNGLK